MTPMTIKEMQSKGGRNRAKKLSAERRKEIASQASRTRWAKRDNQQERKAA